MRLTKVYASRKYMLQESMRLTKVYASRKYTLQESIRFKKVCFSKALKMHQRFAKRSTSTRRFKGSQDGASSCKAFQRLSRWFSVLQGVSKAPNSFRRLTGRFKGCPVVSMSFKTFYNFQDQSDESYTIKLFIRSFM